MDVGYHGFVRVQGAVSRRHRSVQQHQFPGAYPATALHLQRGHTAHQPACRSVQTPQSAAKGNHARSRSICLIPVTIDCSLSVISELEDSKMCENVDELGEREYVEMTTAEAADGENAAEAAHDAASASVRHPGYHIVITQGVPEVWIYRHFIP